MAPSLCVVAFYPSHKRRGSFTVPSVPLNKIQLGGGCGEGGGCPGRGWGVLGEWERGRGGGGVVHHHYIK